MKSVSKVFNKFLGSIFLAAAAVSVASNAWAMAGSPGKDGQAPAGGLTLFAPMILVFLIFYFLLIRPQTKQQKQHQQLLTTLKRGDEVVTAAGIHGTITSVTDTTVGVEIAENVRVRMEKKQVAQVKTKESAEDKGKKK